MANYNISLYQNQPRIVLGFHGCDKSTADKVLTSGTKHLDPSTNGYDWLGDGIYFWLNDPIRALEWAIQKSIANSEKIKQPAVIGAVIDLGNCLDFCERNSIALLKKSHEQLSNYFTHLGIDINEKYKNKTPDEGGFNLLRPLDYAVIKNIHESFNEKKMKFDTVCGYFQEGKDAYPYAGIREKSHIQICVRNTDCIKGYFLPRE